MTRRSTPHGDEPTPSQAEAQLRLADALGLIELAQFTIGRASEKIFRITPLAPECDRLRELYDRIKREWHHLNSVRNGGGYDMDSDFKRAMAQKANATP